MRHGSLALLISLAACDGGTATTDDGDRDPADNTAPTAPEVGLSPTSPVTGDDLVLQVLTPASDAEADAITLAVAWFRDNTPVVGLDDALTVPSSETAKGQTWVAKVTAVDALGARSATVSAQVKVGNAPPEVSVSISPTAPTSTDDIALQIEADDIDGDPVDLGVSWRLNGNPAPSYNDFRTVPASDTTRGQTWTARVVPDDGEVEGDAVEVAVTVANAPPVAGAVTLSPVGPKEASTLQATGTALDPEGDATTLTWSWTVNNVALSGPDTNTLTGAWFNKGDAVRARLTPVDALDARGVAAESAALTILNTAPTLAGAAISPASGNETTVFTCTPVQLIDVDPADAPTTTATWRVNGNVVAGQQLTGASFGRGDTISCSLTATDGTDTTPSVSSPPLAIGNAPPSLTSVTLGPAGASSGTTLTTTPAGAFDADGDVVSFRYAWLVNGTPIGRTTSTLAPPAVVRGDVVVAQVTPTDGTDEGTAVPSNALTITNGTPVLTNLAWNPVHPNSYEDLTLTLTATDPDADPITLVHTWTVNGTVAGGTGPTLSKTLFARGNAIGVTVVATDTLGASASASLSTTIGNAPPTAPTVVLEPSDPLTGDDLLCTRTAPGTDPDGDAVTHSFAWTVNGSTYAGATSDSSSSRVAFTATRENDVWACTGRASDGSLVTPSAPAQVTITGVDCGDLAHDNGLGTCTCDAGTAWCDGDQVDCCAVTSPYFDITVVRAQIASKRPDTTDWDATPLFWAPDVYVKLTVAGVPFGSTTTVDDSYTPAWNQTFSDVTVHPGQTLVLTLMDEDVVFDETIRAISLPYADLVAALDGPDLVVSGVSVTSLVLKVETP